MLVIGNLFTFRFRRERAGDLGRGCVQEILPNDKASSRVSKAFKQWCIEIDLHHMASFISHFSTIRHLLFPARRRVKSLPNWALLRVTVRHLFTFPFSRWKLSELGWPGLGRQTDKASNDKASAHFHGRVEDEYWEQRLKFEQWRGANTALPLECPHHWKWERQMTDHTCRRCVTSIPAILKIQIPVGR